MSSPSRLHPVVQEVTEAVRRRSRTSRGDYLDRMEAARRRGRASRALSCANLAHAFAAAPDLDKARRLAGRGFNLGIVTSYNDVLSAHQPLEAFPEILRRAARTLGSTAQVAGGVPAMCDGVTQGQPGMELSLFSREVIALSTAVSLSHNVFDAALLLGVCDKIVPGLVIGGLSFGHLPTVLVPAGPMPSGLSNKEKARVREEHAAGRVGEAALLESEAKAYHAPGTCTFYGTANSNQMLMELMGLHVPGSAFVPPGTALREALVREAAAVALARAQDGTGSLCEVLDERAFVNGIVGLLATGGSTNHTLHLVAMARAAGVNLDWDDFDRLSAAVPLIARIYPNGSADVNQFEAAGGLAFVARALLQGGLLHPDVRTVAGPGLARYAERPALEADRLVWRPPPKESGDPSVLRGLEDPFDGHGGLKLVTGDLGRAIVKTSAVAPEHRRVEAPARVFADQDDALEAFRRGELDRDVVVVLRFQGPRANGMPELHSLTPALALLQDRGRRVALVTDGRMSGASGKVPAAIHVSPEAALGGPLARVRDGDLIHLDAEAGRLEIRAPDFAARTPAVHQNAGEGLGRELFSLFRRAAAPAELGGGVFTEESAWRGLI